VGVEQRQQSGVMNIMTTLSLPGQGAPDRTPLILKLKLRSLA
jgi:hypothetical protein